MMTKILFLSFALLGWATKASDPKAAETSAQNPAQAGSIEKARQTADQASPAEAKKTSPKPANQTSSAAAKKTSPKPANQTAEISVEKVSLDQKENEISDQAGERDILSESPGPESGFIEFGLEYPLNFGVHLRYLLDDSFYARLGLGFMPGFFLDSFEKLSPSFGYLKEEEAKIISDTFENSMYIEGRLAWAPYLKESGGGPYLELGLSGALHGKGNLKGDSLSKALEDDSFDELKSYSAKTNAINATAHIGYQIPFEKIKLNLEVGLSKILWAEVLPQNSITAESLLNEKQKELFKSFLETKGWIFPTVSGWISFAF